MTGTTKRVLGGAGLVIGLLCAACGGGAESASSSASEDSHVSSRPKLQSAESAPGQRQGVSNVELSASTEGENADPIVGPHSHQPIHGGVVGHLGTLGHIEHVASAGKLRVFFFDKVMKKMHVRVSPVVVIASAQDARGSRLELSAKDAGAKGASVWELGDDRLGTGAKGILHVRIGRSRFEVPVKFD